MPQVQSAVVELDLDDLTLDEMAACEDASGTSFDLILTRAALRRRMVLWMRDYRAAMSSTSGSENYDAKRSWRELGSLRLRDV